MIIFLSAAGEATAKPERTVNPTVYSRKELDKRVRSDHAFVKCVWSQPRLQVVGDAHELAA